MIHISVDVRLPGTSLCNITLLYSLQGRDPFSLDLQHIIIHFPLACKTQVILYQEQIDYFLMEYTIRCFVT